jgi:hypothetical protein
MTKGEVNLALNLSIGGIKAIRCRVFLTPNTPHVSLISEIRPEKREPPRFFIFAAQPALRDGDMIRIALTGTYCSCNKGDAAMELGALQALGQLIQDAEFTIHTPFPEIDRKVYGATHLFKSSRRQLIKSFFLLWRCLLWSFICKRFKRDLSTGIPISSWI